MIHYTIRPRGLIPARLQSPDAENRTSGGVGALAGATSRQGDPISYCPRLGPLPCRPPTSELWLKFCLPLLGRTTFVLCSFFESGHLLVDELPLRNSLGS